MTALFDGKRKDERWPYLCMQNKCFLDRLLGISRDMQGWVFRSHVRKYLNGSLALATMSNWYTTGFREVPNIGYLDL